MTLTIGRLHVRARLPKRLRARAPDAARLARDVLPGALGRHLHRVPAAPAVCRIRRLHVRVQLTPRQLDEQQMTEACAEAFVRALLTAINQPPGFSNTVAAASVERWFADAIVATLDGGLSGWMFDEFAGYEGRPAHEIVVSIVRDHDADWTAVLAACLERGQLDRLILALGASGCRDLVRAIAQRGSWALPASLNDLAAIGAALVSAAADSPRVRSESLDAVVLRLAAAFASRPDRARPFSPPALRAAVAALWWLASRLTEDESASVKRDGTFPLEEMQAAPGVIPLVQSVLDGWTERDGAPEAVDAGFRSVLMALRPSGARQTRPIERHESAVAGMLLLVPVIERLGLPENVRRSELGAAYGSRAITYVLTATALALIGEPPSAASRIDPGIAVFAGWGNDVDPYAIVRICRDRNRADYVELIRTLVGDAFDADAVSGADSAFAGIGAWLVRRFADGLRGFSKSSERFIVSRMLAVGGTIDVDDRRVLVRLHANPFWPVVRLSGADAPVDAVSWLAGRRLTFELEGV
jgi:hypothetical protein